MAPSIKIALIQLHPEPLSPEANFLAAASYLRAAASQGVHLGVLPEYHLTSWAPHRPEFLGACKSSAHYLGKYKSLAKELGICIVPGTLVEVESEPEPESEPEETTLTLPPPASSATRLANVAYFIDDRGNIVSRYQKKNLWHDERPHLTADTETAHGAFDTNFGGDGGCRMGMLICWDLAFPEAMRELVRDGARVVVVPAFWMADEYKDSQGRVVNPDSEKVFLDSVVVARACESSAAVVFVNVGGPGESKIMSDEEEEGVKYCGVSQVGLPLIGSVGRLGENEGMSIVDVNLETLDAAEKGYKVREDLAKEGWHYGYSLTKEDEVATSGRE